MGVSVRVGFKDSARVQSGQNFPLGGFGSHEASGAFGAHGLLRAGPLATNCWPEAPCGGGQGGSRGSWRPRTRAPPRDYTVPKTTADLSHLIKWTAWFEHRFTTTGAQH